MRRQMMALQLALVVAFLAAAPAGADVRIMNLMITDSAGGSEAVAEFPHGTERVYGTFDYEGLGDERIGVSVEGRGIINLYTSSATYPGDGHAAVELNGGAFYRSVAASLGASSEAAQTSINRASSATVGMQEYLEQIQGAVNTINALLDYLVSVPLGSVGDAELVTAQSALDQIASLVDQARRIPRDDVAARQAKAEQMKRPATLLVTSAQTLVTKSADVTIAPIAVTQTGNEYTVMVTVDGLPAASTDFSVVFDARLYLPRVGRER